MALIKGRRFPSTDRVDTSRPVAPPSSWRMRAERPSPSAINASISTISALANSLIRQEN